jgi:uncharacterized membrane protein YhaH (DUF805 family)
MEWFLKVVRDNYANFSGRARRKEYWLFNLFYIIFAIIVMFVEYIFGTVIIFMGLFMIALIIPSMAVTVRRMHDIGKSGWWLLITFIPLFGSIWFFILLCTNSQKGENQYGLSPKE